jgi:hypothetical protein
VGDVGVSMLTPDPGMLDPVAELRALAGRLAATYSTDRGNTAIARELRLTLQALMGLPDETRMTRWPSCSRPCRRPDLRAFRAGGLTKR